MAKQKSISAWWTNRIQKYYSQVRKFVDRDAFYLTDKRCQEEQLEAFRKLGWDFESALTYLNETLSKLGKPPFQVAWDSQHWLVFAALAKTVTPPRRIVEIGTFDGEFTAILAKLFPNAEIITIDLPDDDPQVARTYHRGDPVVFQQFLECRMKNLTAPNICHIQKNGFHLPALGIHDVDLIWLDGDHSFPALAWDFCNAYHLLRDGGTVVCDDVYRFPLNDTSPRAHSRIVIDYLEAAHFFKVDYLLKRVARVHSADPWHRKYLGVLRK